MHRLMILTLLALLAIPSLAQAGSYSTLYYWGNGGEQRSVTMIDANATAAGSLGTDNLSTWPATLDPYILIYISLAEQAFTAQQIADLDAFMTRGGTLVVIIDSEGFTPNGHVIANDLIAALGYDIRFVPAQLESGCDHPASSVRSHIFTTDVVSMDYAWTADIDLNSVGTPLLTGADGHHVIAAEDALVLVTDLDMMSDDNCTLEPGNQQFLWNLFFYSPLSDWWGDDDDATGDDDDATATDDDDVTADDDDAADDDDSASSDDDDDGGGGGGSSRRGGCGCSTGSGSSASLGLLLLVGALRRRR